MRKLPSAHLLKKYTDGNATPEEIEEVEAWYAASEADETPLDVLSAEEKRGLAAKIRSHIVLPEEVIDTPVIGLRPWVWVARIAATVTIILLAGWGLIQYRTATRQLTYTNPLKLPKRVMLADSSTVWLHPGATVTIARDFGESTRSLTLGGVAFFQVKRDEKRPFIVHTNGVFTQVLGTSFTIDARPGNARVEVAVLSGKVRVQKERSDEYVILLPAQKARYAEQQVLSVSPSKNTDISAVWKPESIEFDNTPLSEIARVLSKRFGVKIYVTNASIYTCQLTANFTDQNLPAMLDMIGKSLDLTYEMDQDKVVLAGKGCSL